MLDLSVWYVCLALNIYHEARNEPIKGQLAVALTTLNRADYRRSRICRVVFKDRQFSWTIGSNWQPKDGTAWNRSLHLARSSFGLEDFTEGATHFHAMYVSPDWARRMVFVGKWGAHCFYRLPKYPEIAKDGLKECKQHDNTKTNEDQTLGGSGEGTYTLRIRSGLDNRYVLEYRGIYPDRNR